MGRRQDAALTLLVAVPMALLVVLVRPPIRVQTVALGVTAVLVLEGASLLVRSAVRNYWERSLVQGVAVVSVGVLAAVGVFVEGELLVAVLSGLVTYLAVLAVVVSLDRRTTRRDNS
ncbi:hypothetical protein ACH9L7_07115 [Haloferax sp. S1W]|uniref:hypothetical protein n=1 Tax=Haloferax sp. S1W TaxID=3377110 RepID=UPI0037CC007A